MRIVVLGGGFGGVATVRHLERVLRRRPGVEITLVSRENFFVLTPLLFEACSGSVELRHCAQPIRTALRRSRFIEATVESVDLERQLVRAVASDGGTYGLPYDHLVVALGASTNDGLIPGSSNALTFKTMADALVLRNHLVECFERADASADAAQRCQCLTVVVIGGGLVGVELVGELTAFADDVLRFYPRIRRDEVCFRLFEAGPRILPEIDAKLAAAATRVLERRGVDIQASTAVRSIDGGRVRLENGTIDAGTIVLAAGIVPSAVASAIPVARDQRGRIAVDATMRSRSHPQVWALGDCAAIPSPDGRPYPALAQHAIREARHLAENIRAVIDGRVPSAFTFSSFGTMVSLGHTRAVARAFGVRLTGFLAWWLRRTYYLFQMPRWDRRLRIVLDWTVALFFRPDITRVDLRVEREQVKQARQLVERSSETVGAMQTKRASGASSVNAIPGVDERARRMHPLTTPVVPTDGSGLAANFSIRRRAFRTLHETGCFVIPNPWDVGSARYLQHFGFSALATTSAGFAFSRGLPDSEVALSRDRNLAHIAEIVAAVEVPVNADFASGYGKAPQDVADNVRRCIATGAAGLSIEDATGDPSAPLYDLPLAIERVHAARQAIDDSRADVLLTARAECYLVGHPDALRESVRRLQAYAAAGADVLFAPGPHDPADVTVLVQAVRPKPINLLVVRDTGLSVADIAALGVRRISVGPALALAAWAGFTRAVQILKSEGSFGGFANLVPYGDINGFFTNDHRARQTDEPR